MKYGFLYKVFGACVFIGATVILGYTGASDLGIIGVGETVRRLSEGGAVAAVGIAGMIAVLVRNELDARG